MEKIVGHVYTHTECGSPLIALEETDAGPVVFDATFDSNVSRVELGAPCPVCGELLTTKTLRPTDDSPLEAQVLASMSEAEQHAYFASVNAWYNIQGFESEPEGAIIEAMIRADVPPPGDHLLAEAVAQWQSEVDPNDPRPPHEQVIKRHRA